MHIRIQFISLLFQFLFYFKISKPLQIFFLPLNFIVLCNLLRFTSDLSLSVTPRLVCHNGSYVLFLV